MKNLIFALFPIFLCSKGFAQDLLLHNVYNRTTTSLNGNWKFVIDPYETGYRNHRNWIPFDVMESTKNSARPYYTDRVIEERWDRVEYNFNTSGEIQVPGDWNSQDLKLLYYEGSAWYRTTFDYDLKSDHRLFVHFGAANYQADVYVNGAKVGQHLGGFNPFNFDITDYIKAEGNSLVVRIDNRREKHRVPNYTTDWWNYGGITRNVDLVEVPTTYIQDYSIQLNKENTKEIKGYVKLAGKTLRQQVTISIPELGLQYSVDTDMNGLANFVIPAKKIKRWYPERPKLYDVSVQAGGDVLTDRIGFRTIETRGADILLNGKSIFLRGISLHEENPLRAGRARSMEDAKLLMGWAKELNCNFIRLAH